MNHRGTETQRDTLTESVIGAAIEVHRALGPGLLESAYEQCLGHELGLRGVSFQRQVPIPLQYKGVALDCGYRVDMLVDGQLILELKTAEVLLPVYEAQLLTYMKLLNSPTGLLINFNVPVLIKGIKRLKL